MKLTLKENIILSKIIGNYIIDNKLFYDECESLNKIVRELKEERKNVEVSCTTILKNAPLSIKKLDKIERDVLKEAKEEAKKELRLYDIKTICNRKEGK